MIRLLLALALTLAADAAAARPMAPKVVIVAYFENTPAPGEPTPVAAWSTGAAATRPGELSLWLEREKLTRRIDVPGAFNPVWANADGSVIGVKVGPNAQHPAVNVMALGLDPRFDLRKSYWLFSGIAGISPGVGTIGDAVWTDFVVNGDAAHEIDAREIPAGWPTGYFPPGTSRPYPQPRVAAGSADDVRTWGPGFRTNGPRTVIALNRDLARWAYGLTRDMPLPQTPEMRRARAAYAGYPAAQRPPAVRLGANLASETFWHGKLLNRWASDWTAYMTDGQATYFTCATNDAGALVAIAALGRAGKVDADRVLLLRAGSNFDMPPDGVTPAESLAREGPGAWSAYDPAREALHAVGARVVREIVRNWPRYATAPPNL